jgi:hypothetical protein
MRVDQPLYGMELPGRWSLEELEGADRWVSGARELVVSVLRVPAGPTDRATLLADLANTVAQSRQGVRNFARSSVRLDDDVVMGPDGDLVSASYSGRDDEGGQVFVAVVMTAGPIDGLSYVATVYVLGPDARSIGPDIMASLELGPGS